MTRAADDIEVVTGLQLAADAPFVSCTKRVPDDGELEAAYKAERNGLTDLFGTTVYAFKTSLGRTWVARNGWKA